MHFGQCTGICSPLFFYLYCSTYILFIGVVFGDLGVSILRAVLSKPHPLYGQVCRQPPGITQFTPGFVALFGNFISIGIDNQASWPQVVAEQVEESTIQPHRHTLRDWTQQVSSLGWEADQLPDELMKLVRHSPMMNGAIKLPDGRRAVTMTFG